MSGRNRFLLAETQHWIISLPSYALSAGSQMHKLGAPLIYIQSSYRLPNLHIFITSSLLNVLAALALNPCFTLSLESIPYVSSSTSYWYRNQFLYS